jgi:hypothetical protein
MRVAVAVLFVLAACAIFVVQAEHSVATADNQTSNQTGNHSLNQTNTTANNSTNHTNQTQQNNLTQNNNNTTNSTDDNEDDYNYDYNDEYNNYYDNSSDDNTTESYYQDNDNESPDYGSSGTGAITGVILSSAGSHAVPNANVALYDEDGNLVDIPDNPQLSSNGTGNNGGVYTFYDVPYGRYTVSADKEGVEFFAVVNLTTGTATANVVLPEYVESEPAYREPEPPEVPTPTPRPLRYFIPITVGKMPAAGAPQDNLPYGLAAIGSVCALFLFTRRNGNGKS